MFFIKFHFSLIIFLIFLLPQRLAVAAPNNSKNVYQWSPNSSVSKVDELDNVTMVSSGNFHSLALDDQGFVWAWGGNTYGQLGNGTKNAASIPQKVLGPNGNGFLSGVQSIAAGDNFSMALMHDSTVFAWGENGSGVRGTAVSGNDAQDLLFPSIVKKSTTSNLSGIAAIAGGDDYSIALSSDGKVYVWGYNSNGELGIGCFPSLGQCSRDFIPNATVPGIEDVIKIAAGGSHILVINSDREVWGWGRALEGQLGNSTNLSRISSPIKISSLVDIIDIAAENYGSNALTSNGNVLVWGKGEHNPITVQGLPKIVEVSSGSFYDLAVDKDGTVWQWDRDNIVAQQVPFLFNIAQVEGGMSTPNLAVEGIDTTPSGPDPFLDLPLNYNLYNKTFEQVAFNPASWFDHEYPLQNANCCLFTALNYAGNPSNFYKSHNGYDYASAAGINLGEPVLAAANGFASFIPEVSSGGLGNTIKIDHGNGYQTWYGHLKSNGLVISDQNSAPILVTKGQTIGYVGMTGNTTGPHIHFSVFKDSNDNGSFDDDNPFGLVDPLGWEGEDQDPWELWEQNDRKGTKSYNLFIENAPPEPEIIPPSGGQIIYKNFTVNVPGNAYNGTLKVEIKNGPFSATGELLKSVMPSIILRAFDNLNNQVRDFLEPIEVVFDFSNADLSNIDEETLSVYYFDDEQNEWVNIPATINTDQKTATFTTNHFSQFALMGEQIDLIAPTTETIITGDEGTVNWFRSDVLINLIAEDNERGLGIFDTIYSLDNGTWDNYSLPIEVNSEGEHSVSFMSTDNAGNEEVVKTVEFNIDKTTPQVEVETDKATLWPPNGKLVPVIVDGSSTDEHLYQTIITVEDEYNEVEPSITNFGETVLLEASRMALDRNGRKYTINATASDKAGNSSTSTTEVIVPHDQGKLKEVLSWLIFKLISSIK